MLHRPGLVKYTWAHFPLNDTPRFLFHRPCSLIRAIAPLLPTTLLSPLPSRVVMSGHLSCPGSGIPRVTGSERFDRPLVRQDSISLIEESGIVSPDSLHVNLNPAATLTVSYLAAFVPLFKISGRTVPIIDMSPVPSYTHGLPFVRFSTEVKISPSLLGRSKWWRRRPSNINRPQKYTLPGHTPSPANRPEPSTFETTIAAGATQASPSVPMEDFRRICRPRNGSITEVYQCQVREYPTLRRASPFPLWMLPWEWAPVRPRRAPSWCSKLTNVVTSGAFA